jgi:RHS repeat-associated protein
MPTTYTYSAAGLAATATLPNGLVTTYTYDRTLRLTNLTNVVGSTTITSHAYTLDSEGNRTAQTEFVSGITTGTSDSFGYTYDGLNRLTAVTTTNAESFTLDSASNISSRTGPSATYTYDTSNRLSSDGGQSFTWSNADRLTARGSDSFGYDALDRLTSSTVSGTARTYGYNADGLLQNRTQGGSTTNFLWDPATSPSRLLEIGSDKLVYGLGPLYVVTGSGTTTFARDGGRSIRAELSGSGSVVGTFRYKAYGSIAQSNGASTPSYLGYADQLLDPSGQYYMRARWYDPAAGRFLSRDGADTGATTAFGYANANPVALADPSGLDADLTDAGGGGGGSGRGCDIKCEWPVGGFVLAKKAQAAGFRPGTACDYFKCQPIAVAVTERQVVVRGVRITIVVGEGVVLMTSAMESGDLSDDDSAVGAGKAPPPSPYGPDGKFTKAVQALIELAKRAVRTGMTREEAAALNEWRIEYGVDGHGLRAHDYGELAGVEHIKVGPIRHIILR